MKSLGPLLERRIGAMTGLTQQRPVRGIVDTRLKISALWIAMLFIFAYVDLFSLYRSDVRADLDAGRLFAFDVSETFLFFTTLYIVLPSLMIYLTLVMPRGISRVVNIVLAAGYAITIVGSAVGEWGYFVVGSAAEVVLLGAVVYHAWTWREPAG
jgi:hypothetical protein